MHRGGISPFSSCVVLKSGIKLFCSQTDCSSKIELEATRASLRREAFTLYEKARDKTLAKLLHSLLPTAAMLDASGCLLTAKGSDGGGMACEQMKYMAASPPTASLIICTVVYTRKKYTHIGKSFTVIPMSGGL